MQDFIVSGQIPGTGISISFEAIVAFIAVATGVYMLYSAVSSAQAANAEAIKAASVKKPRKNSKSAKSSVATHPAPQA